jgi:hypothetical protein
MTNQISAVFAFVFLMAFAANPAFAKSKEAKFVIKNGYKSITRGGIIYKGTTAVSDIAFKRAQYVVDAMLENIPYVRTRMTEVGYKIVIMGIGQKLTDIPEYEFFKGKKANQSTIGLKRSFDTQVPGMSEYELCVISENYLINALGDDIMAHEMAHAILFHMYREDVAVVQDIYMKAFQKRLFPTRTYLMNNSQEYFAVLSVAWLGLSRDHNSNAGVDTAEKVKARDPKMAEFLEQTYGTRTLDLLINAK